MDSISASIARVVRAELLNQDGITKISPFRRFSTLYSEQSPSDSVLFLDSGLVILCTHGEDGKDVILQVIAPGELFGELSLGMEPTRDVTARTLADSTIHIIPKTLFITFCDTHPGMWRLFVELLVQRSRDLETRIELLCTKPVEHRILHCIFEAAKSFGLPVGGGTYSVPLSQEEFAALVGATRETTSATLNQLARRGLIRLGRRQIIVPSLNGAAAAAGD